jgi:glycosyltransferase involved in cell wall biosynthesis
MPKVSVIIPAYNSSSSLKRSVDSVLNQKYDNIEIIIVDDGSTDDTNKIANKLSAENNNIKVVTQKNLGPGEARNSGIAASIGEYTIFLDSDDVLLPWSIDELLSVAVQEDADIVCGTMLESSSPEDDYAKLLTGNGKKAEYHVSPNGYIDLLYMRFLPSPHAKMYRASLIKNESFAKYYLAEDLDFNLRIFRKARKICSLSSPVVEIYTLTEGSIMRSAYNDKKREEIYVLRKIHAEYEKTKEEKYKKAYAASLFFHSVGLARMIYDNREAMAKYSSDFKELKKYIKECARTVAKDKNALSSQRKYALAASVSISAMFSLMRKAEKRVANSSPNNSILTS